MAVFVRHPELLMQLKIDIEDARTHDAFPPHIAELPNWGFIIRPQAKVAGWGRIAQVRAETSCIGAIVGAGRARVIHASDGQCARRAALQCKDTAGLPPPGDGIEKPVIDIQ